MAKKKLHKMGKGTGRYSGPRDEIRRDELRSAAATRAAAHMRRMFGPTIVCPLGLPDCTPDPLCTHPGPEQLIADQSTNARTLRALTRYSLGSFGSFERLLTHRNATVLVRNELVELVCNQSRVDRPVTRAAVVRLLEPRTLNAAKRQRLTAKVTPSPELALRCLEAPNLRDTDVAAIVGRSLRSPTANNDLLELALAYGAPLVRIAAAVAPHVSTDDELVPTAKTALRRLNDAGPEAIAALVALAGEWDGSADDLVETSAALFG